VLDPFLAHLVQSIHRLNGSQDVAIAAIGSETIGQLGASRGGETNTVGATGNSSSLADGHNRLVPGRTAVDNYLFVNGALGIRRFGATVATFLSATATGGRRTSGSAGGRSPATGTGSSTT